jgi:hypothetical protein
MTPVEASDRRRDFCARLKSERERRGTRLEAIVASTKIKGSLLDGLERGDLSRWPKGIYRRAFFRDYVAAIGLPSEPTVSDFLELFSDGEPVPGVSKVAAVVAPEPVTPPSNLRLFLGGPATTVSRANAGPGLQARLAAAAADMAAIGLVAWGCSAVLHVNMMSVTLVLGAACYVVATWHQSPSLQLFAWLTRANGPRPAVPQVHTFEPSTLPYNAHAPAVSRSALRGRLVDAASGGRSLIRQYVERLSEADLTFKSQRRRDLASVRRQRAEAANRATADEISVM